MPPKSKSPRSAKKSGTKTKSSAQHKAAHTPQLSHSIATVELEARTTALAAFRERNATLAADYENVTAEKRQNDIDSLQVISYLRRDGERKDDLIDSLKAHIDGQEAEFDRLRHEAEDAAREQYTLMESTLRGELREANDRLQAASDELAGLREFRERKADFDQEVRGLEQQRDEVAQQYEARIRQRERKYLEEKGKLQQECKDIITEMKKRSQEEAVERLDASTKKILIENRRMAEELRLQIHETESLQKAKAALEEENKQLSAELSLAEDAAKEYAKQGYRHKKERSELSAKVRGLELKVSSAAREHASELHEMSTLEKHKREESEVDAAGLRELVRHQRKEIVNVKRVAAFVLQKRTDVEKFLLESIEVVRGEIGRQQQDAAARDEREREGPRVLAARGGGRLPALGGVVPTAARRPTRPPDARVDISKLSWDERERILRLLFAKINSTSVAGGLSTVNLSASSGLDLTPGVSDVMVPPVDTGRGQFFVTQPEVV